MRHCCCHQKPKVIKGKLKKMFQANKVNWKVISEWNVCKAIATWLTLTTTVGTSMHGQRNCTTMGRGTIIHGDFNKGARGRKGLSRDGRFNIIKLGVNFFVMVSMYKLKDSA